MADVTAGSCLVDGVCEVTLETRDRPALEAFYTSALGLRVLSRESDRTWLACGWRARLGLWTPGAKEFGDQGGRHVHFALSVAPGVLEAACARLRWLGVDFRGPVEHRGGDRSVYCEDPAGNVLELWDFFERGRGGHHGVDALAAAQGQRPVTSMSSAVSTRARPGNPAIRPSIEEGAP